MRISRNLAILLLILLAVGVAAFAAMRLLREPPGDEERIRAIVDAAVRAAEERRPGDVVAAVSDRFQGQGLGRRELKQMVTAQLLRGSWNTVIPVSVRVDVDGDRARLVVDAALVRGAKGEGILGKLPESGDSWRIDATLEREGGAWKVVSATWQPHSD